MRCVGLATCNLHLASLILHLLSRIHKAKIVNITGGKAQLGHDQGHLGAMLGRDVARRIGEVQRGRNRSASRFALIEIANLWRDRKGRTTREIQTLAERFTDELRGPRLDPFSSAQMSRLRERFEADWDALASGAVAGVDTFDPLAYAEGAT